LLIMFSPKLSNLKLPSKLREVSELSSTRLTFG
jgi:hypothetical protein